MSKFAGLTIVFVLAATGRVADAASNVLLILADDMGVEALSVYGLGETAPTTAALEKLAQEGVVFTNFWSRPFARPLAQRSGPGATGFDPGRPRGRHPTPTGADSVHAAAAGEAGRCAYGAGMGPLESPCSCGA